MKKELSLANKIWEIIYPVAMYYATIVIAMFCAQFIFGAGNETYMLCKIIGSVVTLVVVWSFYKRDLALEGKLGRKFHFTKDAIINALWILGITVCISISLNNIITMSPLMGMSESYDDAANAFYGSDIWVELLGSALITPILEEMLHRGVVYNRLRHMTGRWMSILISSLIFAGLHFNAVQFVYAFLLGIVFACFMEKTGWLYAPILAHVVANAIAVVRTETGILASTIDGSLFAWGISVGLLLAGIVGLVIYCRKIFGKVNV